MIFGAGCAPDPDKLLDPSASKEQRVFLPVKPTTFGKPVPIPPRTLDVRAWAKRASESLKAANGRLLSDGKFYDDVQRDFGRPR